MLSLECDPARLSSHVEECRNNCVLAYVFGDVLLAVVRPHLLLVDVLFEDVAEHIRIDLTSRPGWTVVKVPIVLLEEIEDAVECLVGDVDTLTVDFFNLVSQKKPAVQIRY